MCQPDFLVSLLRSKPQHEEAIVLATPDMGDYRQRYKGEMR